MKLFDPPLVSGHRMVVKGQNRQLLTEITQRQQEKEKGRETGGKPEKARETHKFLTRLLRVGQGKGSWWWRYEVREGERGGEPPSVVSVDNCSRRPPLAADRRGDSN